MVNSKKSVVVITAFLFGCLLEPSLAKSTYNQAGCHPYASSPASVVSTWMKLRGGSDIPDGGDVPPSAEIEPTTVIVEEEEVAAPAVAVSSVASNEISVAPVMTQEEVTTPSSQSAVVNPKWANFVQRVGPAALMLAGLYFLFAKLGKEGLVWLVPLLQIGMYHEVMHNVLELPTSNTWFMLLPYLLKTHGFLQRYFGTSTLNLSSFTLYAAGLIYAIMKLNTQENLTPEIIQSFLGRSIAAIATLVVILSPCQFWIKTAGEYGLLWVLFPALLVIINDTMAYAFGVMLGKTPLLRVLSPKKSVEGFVGAGVSTVTLAVPLLNFLMNRMTSPKVENLTRHALALAVYTSIVSPFGGYLASTIKRAHGKKDFGNTIPGHGGIVDRLDCQLITAPFVFYYLNACAGASSTPPSV
eukprot:CAMPEP_0197832590 /NCGR_PEP_ID=MMETSP1437-20131217/15292_1 /TAXON_ID=49252 ORGANISM="Eucampia antarctica, Strain CCMP1452" /NCGR_SAMPLE_ID=MMETSP1437 /ASSEMBLY_ACC=CAM_ASM_001096 /LENGTH=411 /DNA_ID=CAMNT_0043436033 /DNA_START=43 /DNA_END=1278 /DNA_ORIENTATION=-